MDPWGEALRCPANRFHLLPWAPRRYWGFGAEGLVYGGVVLADVVFAHETDG